MRNVPASSCVSIVGHQLIILFGRKNLAEGMVDWAGPLGSKAWPHFLFTLCPLTEEAMWVQPPVPATKYSPPMEVSAKINSSQISFVGYFNPREPRK